MITLADSGRSNFWSVARADARVRVAQVGRRLAEVKRDPTVSVRVRFAVLLALTAARIEAYAFRQLEGGVS